MAQPPTDQPAWLDQPPTAIAPKPAPTVPESPSQFPAWQQPPRPRGTRLWIYVSGALVLVGLLGGGVYFRGAIMEMQAENNQQYVASSPTPFLSDYERADRFMNVDLVPAFAALVTPLQSVGKDCSPKTMAAPCKPDLIALDKAMITGETTLAQGDTPVCIGPSVNQLKYDWLGMEQGVGLAISGYTNNSYDLYLQGMVKFAEIAQYLNPDLDRIKAAEGTCSKTLR